MKKLYCIIEYYITNKLERYYIALYTILNNVSQLKCNFINDKMSSSISLGQQEKEL